MRTRLSKALRGGAGVALLASGLGVIGALGVGVATSGVASAVTHVSALYKCATPLGTKSVQTTIKTLNNTPQPSVTHGSTYTAKPRLTANIPAALINTAATATASLTSLPVLAATLQVAKVGLTGPGFFVGAPKPTKTTLLTIVPINATTKVHGYTATITYQPATFTVTASTGTATLTPTTLTLSVVVALKCFTPTHSIHYSKLPPPTTTSTNFSTYTVTGTNTLTPMAKVTAIPHVTPLKLTPPSGTNPPAATAGSHYSSGNFWTASTGHGSNVWTPASVDGLSFSGTGSHGSLTGTPTTAGPFTFTVTVTTGTGTTTITHSYTITVGAAAATPTVLQPFTVTVTAGPITLTCESVTPLINTPVENQNTAADCAPIAFGKHVLNGKNTTYTAPMHTLYILTARGTTSNEWSLTAQMITTTTSVTGKAACNTVIGFCNVTTINNTHTTPHRLTNSTITAHYVGIHGFTCKAQSTKTSIWYNVNPTPTTAAGRRGSFGTHGAGLGGVVGLCTTPTPGVSGGEFIVSGGDFTIIVPPNVYVGKYYGTVQFTLVAF
jgi:hypothetical protein